MCLKIKILELFVVISRHCTVNTDGNKALNELYRLGYQFRKGFLFLRGPLSQYIINLLALGKSVPNTETEATVFSRIECGGNIREAVMTSVTSLLFHAQGSKRQGKVVGYDDEILERNFLGLQPVIDGPSAQIHVGGRLDDDDLFAFKLRMIDEGEFIVREQFLARVFFFG